MSRTAAPIALAALMAALAGPAPARAETVNCTPINSLPATLASQGVYCLKKDLATSLASGAAVTIAANNVTIDCNGYKLGGLAAGTSTGAAGILAENRANAVVRNCNVRGFAVGINVQGSGHTVEGNRLDGNTRIGIVALGDGSLVARNRVFDTGGGPAGFIPYVGIYTAESVDVRRNTVSGVTATAGSGQWAAGIFTGGNLDGEISGNRVRGVFGAGGGSHGIRNDQSGVILLRDNQVVGSGTGTGLSCASAAGMQEDNQVLGFALPVVTCSTPNVNGGT